MRRVLLALLLAAAAPLAARAQEGAPAPAERADAAQPAERPGLVIRRNGIGRLAVEGVVPSAKLDAELRGRIEGLSENGRGAALTVGGEEAGPNWLERLDAGLAALAELEHGQVTLYPSVGELTGLASDEAARDRTLAALGDGAWVIDIKLLPPRMEPYVFRAEKTADGATYAGFAPDDGDAAVLEAVVDDTLGVDASGTIGRARGMPNDEWPELVRSALRALALAETGLVEIEGQTVDLTASVADAGAKRRLEELVGPGWTVAIETLDAAPEPSVTLTVSPDGGLSARGRLPESVGGDAIEKMLGPVTGALAGDAYGERAVWTDAIDALAIAVPRMSAGEIRLGDRIASFEGTLRPGFSAPDLSSALRATLGPGWQTELTLREAPPPPSLALNLMPGGVEAEGILPEGVEVRRLLAPLGRVGIEGLALGGDGEAGTWTGRVDALAHALGAFEVASARAEDGVLRVTGTLKPGYEAATLRDWLDTRFVGGWKVELEAADRPGKEGDRRTDFVTGAETALTHGYWLPVQRFEATPARCVEEVEAAQADQAVTFAAGADTIDPGLDLVLNRLAAVIGHCLRSLPEMRLDIGGHTDDRGEPLENLVLSEQRAKSVAQALVDRGLPEDRIAAVGYGDTEPVADNATPEGRAANRRIEFYWHR